jgi:hypothetical protein
MRPILKLYRGYANEQELIVDMFLNQLKKKDYDFLQKFKKRSVIGLFRIKTNQMLTYT